MQTERSSVPNFTFRTEPYHTQSLIYPLLFPSCMKWGVFVIGVLFVLLVSSASATHTKARSSFTAKQISLRIDTSTFQPRYSIPSRYDFSFALYRCMDSDGGINPPMRGAVLRIPLRPSQACIDWVTEFNQQCPPNPMVCESIPSACAAILAYCNSVELPAECFGEARVDFCRGSRELREYYCSGSNIRYRDITCSTACSYGSCVEAR